MESAPAHGSVYQVSISRGGAPKWPVETAMVGPEGLAGGRRVIVAVSRGGFYDQGNSLEHVEAYLKPLFNFLGIEPEFVFADGIGVSAEQRETAIANSLTDIERLAA